MSLHDDPVHPGEVLKELYNGSARNRCDRATLAHFDAAGGRPPHRILLVYHVHESSDW